MVLSDVRLYNAASVLIECLCDECSFFQFYCRHCGNNFCSKCCNQKVPKSTFGATCKYGFTNMLIGTVQTVAIRGSQSPRLVPHVSMGSVTRWLGLYKVLQSESPQVHVWCHMWYGFCNMLMGTVHKVPKSMFGATCKYGFCNTLIGTVQSAVVRKSPSPRLVPHVSMGSDTSVQNAAIRRSLSPGLVPPVSMGSDLQTNINAICSIFRKWYICTDVSLWDSMVYYLSILILKYE